VAIKEQPKLIDIGKAEIIQSFSSAGSRKVALFPLGNMMSLGRKVAAQLAAEDCDVALINPRFVKPIDAGTTEFFGRTADLVVTFEDHVLHGGYGSAVLELFNDKRVTTPVIMVGWPDQFIEHGTNVDDLRKKYGLTVENTVARVKAELAEIAMPAERRSGLVVA